jgi:hypothetical protein
MQPFRAGSFNLTERQFVSIRTQVFCLTILLVCAASTALFAKSTFSIAGKVKTVAGHAFPMAVVKVDNGMGMTVAVFSKPNGKFVIKGLRPGRYEVSAEQSGYPRVSQSIVLPGAKSVSLVLREGPRQPKLGTDHLHVAMDSGPQPGHFTDGVAVESSSVLTATR